MSESDHQQNSNAVNANNRAMHTAHELHNAMENYAAIKSRYGESVFDIADFDKHKGKDAAIIASGPSLDATAGDLRDFTGIIICSQSQALYLRVARRGGRRGLPDGGAQGHG